MKRLLSYLVLTITLVTAKALLAEVFYLPPDAVNVGPVTQQQADQVVWKLFNIFYRDVYQKMGWPLVLENRWQDPYFGASAIKDLNGRYISVFIRGGFIRVPEMTENILALVLCHELGHVLGGEPYQTLPGSEWTSTEGQSDFFAASLCLPKYFQTKAHGTLSPAELRKKILESSLAAVLLFQKYSFQQEKPVSLEQVAPEVARELVRNVYPSSQCRLDTFKAGANCITDFSSCRAPVCWLPK